MLGTLMLPYHVTLIPQYVLFLNLGWVDTILPLVVPKFLAADAFFIFLLVQFFRGIPRELDEAAIMDGCGPWRIYWKIMLPLATPALATAAVFSFIWTWDDFFAPLIYLNDMSSYTFQIGLRTFVDSGGQSDFSGLMAMSVVGVIPIFILFLFFQRLSDRWHRHDRHEALIAAELRTIRRDLRWPVSSSRASRKSSEMWKSSTISTFGSSPANSRSS